MIATTIGMVWTWRAAASGLASTSILARIDAPFASFASFSSTGLSCLHGPHQSAHRSMITGVVRDRSMTRSLKVSSVTSKTAVCPGAGLAARPGGVGRLLLALRGRLPGAEVDGTVNGEVPRLHDSILPHTLGTFVPGLLAAARRVGVAVREGVAECCRP